MQDRVTLALPSCQFSLETGTDWYLIHIESHRGAEMARGTLGQAVYFVTACSGYVIAGPLLILLNNQLLHACAPLPTVPLAAGTTGTNLQLFLLKPPLGGK